MEDRHESVLHKRHLWNKIRSRYLYVFKGDINETYKQLYDILRTEEMSMLKFLELSEYVQMLKFQIELEDMMFNSGIKMLRGYTI